MSQSINTSKVPSSSGLPAVTTESDSSSNGSDASKCCSVLDQLNSEMEHVDIGATMESYWDVIARISENEAAAKVTQWESSTVTRSGWEHSVTTPTNLDPEPMNDYEKQDDALDDDYDFLDDDDFLNEDYDSDASEKSYETRKKNKWLRSLFGVLNSLDEEQINDTNRRWHCPACHDGPGAIAYYWGLQPLISHAKTKGTRIKLHRELAALLEDELRRRGTSIPTKHWENNCASERNPQKNWETVYRGNSNKGCNEANAVSPGLLPPPLHPRWQGGQGDESTSTQLKTPEGPTNDRSVADSFRAMEKGSQEDIANFRDDLKWVD